VIVLLGFFFLSWRMPGLLEGCLAQFPRRLVGYRVRGDQIAWNTGGTTKEELEKTKRSKKTFYRVAWEKKGMDRIPPEGRKTGGGAKGTSGLRWLIHKFSTDVTREGSKAELGSSQQLGDRSTGTRGWHRRGT